jgi:hypothetical protein
MGGGGEGPAERLPASEEEFCSMESVLKELSISKEYTS